MDKFASADRSVGRLHCSGSLSSTRKLETSCVASQHALRPAAHILNTVF